MSSSHRTAFQPTPAYSKNRPADFHAIRVDSEHAGERLDRFLAGAIPVLSRSRMQDLIDRGRVTVDGVACKRSHRVSAGESVQVEMLPPPAASVKPEPIPVEILYQDEDVAVVNKPAGIIVHPGAGAKTGTLVSALLNLFGGSAGLSSIGGALRAGIVHRLDKGTSGALAIALNDAAHKNLVEQFSRRQVRKTYVALLHGRIKGDSGTIEMPIARDLRRRSRMTARRREGRPARTEWRVLARMDGFELVEANLHTGRTHQLRVHFSALGCPVVGDTLYGAPRQERAGAETLPDLGRNFLHAARICFSQPRTGERIDVRAPLPPALRAYIAALAHALESDPAAIDAALRPFL
ncbi:MAG: RluA family pseudouridine synthase [Acidobacteriota bacterium]|nr:RluA family pseudouridine synthase [Acidobacteriota bacterium]